MQKSKKVFRAGQVSPLKVGVRETLTGYFVPGRVGHGAWITWDLLRVSLSLSSSGFVIKHFSSPNIIILYYNKSRILSMLILWLGKRIPLKKNPQATGMS